MGASLIGIFWMIGKFFIRQKKNRCIVFDIETTGLNPMKDQILEIAAIEVENLELTCRIFHVFIKPKMSISEKSIDFHKIENGDF